MSYAFSTLKRYAELFGPAYGTDKFSLFLYSLVKMECPVNLLELGTGYGVSALWLALALEENGAGHVWSIDDGREFENKMDMIAMRNLYAEINGCSADQARYDAPEFNYHGYLRQMAAFLGLSQRVTFVSTTLDHEDPVRGLRNCSEVLDKPLDLVFSDYASSASGLYSLVGGLLPYMADRGSIFLDSVSTQLETYLAVERLVVQFNDKRIPSSVAKRYTTEHNFRLNEILASHELRLSHIIEPGRQTQNSRAWIQIQAVDLIPFPDRLWCKP